MEEDRKHTWIISVPYVILMDKDLPSTAKLIMFEIYSLIRFETPYCYASNQHFANILGLTTTQVSKHINLLKKKGYVKVRFEKGDKSKRFIFPSDVLVALKQKLKSYTTELQDPSLTKPQTKQYNIEQHIEQTTTQPPPDPKVPVIRAVLKVYYRVLNIDQATLLPRDRANHYAQVRKLIERTEDLAIIERGFHWLSNQRQLQFKSIGTLDKLWQSFLKVKQKEDGSGGQFFYEAPESDSKGNVEGEGGTA